MGLTVTLYNNLSPVEKIGKDLQSGVSITGCTLKDSTSVMQPVIIVKSSNSGIPTYNYMYIAELQRYYFIDDITSVHNGIWEISGHVDVLETYKNDILGNSAIIENTEQVARNMYLYDRDVFQVNCKHKTDIINFPSGLLDTGEFILITAGG